MTTVKYIAGITDTVVDFASKTQFDDLPEEVVHETKRLLLDSVGCALGGLMVDKGRFAVKLVRRLGGPPESTIIGAGDKVSSVNAAFANGELISALDFESTNTVPHTAPYVLPAPLALAECAGACGKDLILAIALGNEISIRMGKALGGLVEEEGRSKYVTLGVTHGTLAAAASAARILRLDRERLCQAVGIAGYLTPVPANVKWSRSLPSSMIKYGSAGWVSQTGVSSVLLAEMGYVGDTTVLDGEWGFYRFSGALKWKPEELIDGLGILIVKILY